MNRQLSLPGRQFLWDLRDIGILGPIHTGIIGSEHMNLPGLQLPQL